MIDLQSAEDRTAAAGEYVLGTLSEADHAAFAAALARDPALLAEVYAWQDRLLALSTQAAPATPRPQLWQRIEVAVTAATATAPRPSAAAPQPLRWWQRVAPWQGISGLALAASLVMAVFLGLRSGNPEPASARYLAVLQSPQDHTTGWVVEIDAGRTLRLLPVATTAAAPAGRSLQFWTKPQGASGPTSLGLVRAGQKLELPVSRLPGVGEQQLFEITLEPENGSPIGKPTGPILYVGRTGLI